MAYSADPDQLASTEGNQSGYTLFAKSGYIGVQQAPTLYKLRRATAFPIRLHVRLAKTQLSLCVGTGWSVFAWRLCG